MLNNNALKDTSPKVAHNKKPSDEAGGWARDGLWRLTAPLALQIYGKICVIFLFCNFDCLQQKKAKKHIFYFIVHSLIAFENRIRLSADSLILSADTLIVAELMIRKAEAKRIHSPPLLCFRAVTSSRCHTSIITNRKHACCAGDNSVTTKSKHKSLPHV